MTTTKSIWAKLLTCCLAASVLLSVGVGAVDQTKVTSSAGRSGLPVLHPKNQPSQPVQEYAGNHF